MHGAVKVLSVPGQEIVDTGKNQCRGNEMSVCFSLGCKKCKKDIWIGQSSLVKSYIYTDDKEVMKNLEKFLYDHMDHELVFSTSDGIYDMHFEE